MKPTTRTVYAAAVAAMFVLIAAAPAKVLVCHATGRAPSTHFVTIEVPANDGGYPNGHYTEGGSPLAGHEDDYLGACATNETTTTTSTTTVVPPSATTTTPATTLPPVTTTTEGTPPSTTTTTLPLTTETTTSTSTSTSTTTSSVVTTTPTLTPTTSTTEATPTPTSTITPPTTLPRTGADMTLLTLLGVVLLATGGLLVRTVKED